MDPTKQPPFSSELFSTAPPHYTSPQVWGPTPPSISDKAPHNLNNNHTYAPTSTSTAYSSQPPPQTPRLLHIYSTSLLSHSLTILAPDKQTTAYTIHLNCGSLFSSKPHMKVYRGDNPNDAPPIGTATFHTTTRTIDLTFHNNRPVTLSHHGVFNSKYEFPSAIGVLRWKSAGGLLKSCDLICETVDGGECVAKFEAANFALEKRGKFEIVNGGVGEEGLDEIVVSGLAVVEQMRRTRTAVAAAA